MPQPQPGADGQVEAAARAHLPHQLAAAQRQAQSRASLAGAEVGGPVELQMVGAQTQARRAGQGCPRLGGATGGADRIAKAGAARDHRIDREGLPAAAHRPQAAGAQLQITAGAELTVEHRLATGAEAHLGGGAPTGVGAGDRTLQRQVDGGDRQVAGGGDAAAGAVEGQPPLAAAQADRRGGVVAADLAIDPHIVGAAQADAAAGGGAAQAGGAADLKAVDPGRHRAVARRDRDVIDRLQGALNPQRATGAQGEVAAGAAGDHFALDQAVFTGIESDRAIERLEHAAGIDLHIAAIGAAAAAQVDGAVGPHLAGDIQLAVGATAAADRDRRTGARCIKGIAAARAERGATGQGQTQVGGMAAAAGQHLVLPGASQTQAAIAQLDLEVGQVGVAVETAESATNGWIAGRAVAAGHRPAGGDQGGLQVLGQLGHAGVGASGAGGQGDGRLDGIADLVDLHHQGDVAAELAVARERPLIKGQLVDIERCQQVDATRGIEVDRAVGAAGGDAGGAVQHQTATLVGSPHRGGAAVEAAAQGDALAGGDVGADDQLPVGLHRDLRVDVVALDAAAEIATGVVAHHRAAAAREQQALHVDIIHTAQADLTGRTHAVVVVAGALHHQLGTGLHDQPLAADAVAAALHIDQAAGVEEAAGFGRGAAGPGQAAHKDPARGADDQIRITAAPGDALVQQRATVRGKGLHQPPARIEGAEQLNPAGGVDRHRAALAIDAVAAEPFAQAGAGDATAAVDQQAQRVHPLGVHGLAVPVVVGPGRATAQGHIAAGQQARLDPQLLAGADAEAAASVAIAIDREADAAAADRAAGHQCRIQIDVGGTAHVDRAAGLAGAQGAGGMDIDAGAAAVRPRSTPAQHLSMAAEAAVELEALAGGGEALDKQPLIGLQRQA